MLKARVTFVLRGYGDLTLTEEYLTWNKSASSFLAFGALNAATESQTTIPLNEISTVETYTYVGSGGIKITTIKGQEFKFSFKKKKDFQEFYDKLKR